MPSSFNLFKSPYSSHLPLSLGGKLESPLHVGYTSANGAEEFGARITPPLPTPRLWLIAPAPHHGPGKTKPPSPGRRVVSWPKIELQATRPTSRRSSGEGGRSLPCVSLQRALRAVPLQSPASRLGEDGSPPRRGGRASTTPGRRRRFLLVLLRPPRPLRRPGQGAFRRGLGRQGPCRLQRGRVPRSLTAG